MHRLAVFLAVILVWSTAPVLKRTVLDYMKYPDMVDMGTSTPVRAFVALHSLGCTLAAIALAAPTDPMQYVRRIPSEGWAALLAGVILSTIGGVALVQLLSTGNPGTTMVYLNAGTNIMSYLWGAVFYGKVTWDGCAGVLAVAGGLSLMKGGE